MQRWHGFVSLSLWLAFAGCATPSASSDYREVQTLVMQRGKLELSQAEASQEDRDAWVVELLQKPLTAQSAERIALLHNHALSAELLELGIARGQLAQAGVLPNPEFSVAMRVPEGGTEQPAWDLGAGIDLTGMLLADLRADVAQAELDAARVRTASAVLALALEVRRAFYELLACSERAALVQTSVDAFEAGYEAARALHAAGNVSDLELVSEQAEYEAAKLALSEAQERVLRARERLNVLLGLHGPDTAWTTQARLPDAPAEIPAREVVEAQALEASLALAALRANVSAAAREAGLSEAEGVIPDLTVGVSGEYDGQEWSVGPAISGTLPLFDQKRGGAFAARSRLQQERERYVADAVAIRASVRLVHARVVSTRERAEQYRLVVLPLRRKVLQETLAQHNAMQVGVFQLLQAKRDELEAQRSYVDTLLEHWLARAELDQLVRGGAGEKP